MGSQSEKAIQKQGPLWVPSEEEKANTLLRQFSLDLASHSNFSGFKQEENMGSGNTEYHSLWQYSVQHPQEFWNEVWDFCGVIGSKAAQSGLDTDSDLVSSDELLLSNNSQMFGAQFFPHATLNYAENLLKKRDDTPAIIFRDERSQERILTYNELYQKVSIFKQALTDMGVAKGDRIAGYLPNMPETIIACLAASSIGAIWSSASPDFGAQGLLDRFGQIKPKIIFSVDAYYYNGKVIDCLQKIEAIIPKMASLEKIVVIPFAGEKPISSETLLENIKNTDKSTVQLQTLDDFTANFKPEEISFEHVEFNHPLFIMFSSGTTGVPKCIVHGQGGTLLQHLKEHQLQSNIKPGDRVFYFTTCGWMMWNWLISALASQATLMLFDGSPFYPNGYALWDYAQKHECSFFGTSAKYIDALKVNDINPKDKYALSSLRTISSTGSPLVHESFDFVYQSIKSDVHLASISGGTDIVSCFMLGNPLSPVWRGEIQGPGLGMAIDVFGEDGKPTSENSGELVCTKPFPCMPIKFWNDEDGKKYKAAYFERFDDIWVHGDWIEKTENNGFIIHGRSDATLNPGGVRIGTSEIYRQVEQIEDVAESIAVGQDWQGDVRVILFVILKDDKNLNEDLIKDIKTKVRQGASPRHVPAKIIQVKDIPRTKSGKITELAVRDVIMNRPIKNATALANPEALELYKDMKELQQE